MAVIFGMLNVINFTHGVQYMMGAFAAYFLLQYLGIGYWPALLLAPLMVGAVGIVIEKTMLLRLYKLDHLYGLLLTFGLALMIEGAVPQLLRGLRAALRDSAQLAGGHNLGFMFLPTYRGWVIVASLDRLPRRPGSSSSARALAPICAPAPRTRPWCAPSASTCRA